MVACLALLAKRRWHGGYSSVAWMAVDEKVEQRG